MTNELYIGLKANKNMLRNLSRLIFFSIANSKICNKSKIELGKDMLSVILNNGLEIKDEFLEDVSRINLAALKLDVDMKNEILFMRSCLFSSMENFKYFKRHDSSMLEVTPN